LFFVKKKQKKFFLKKRSKKLFLVWAVLVSLPRAQSSKKFLRRFFQKAAAFLFPLKPIRL
jgi:hypothetical protein